MRACLTLGSSAALMQQADRVRAGEQPAGAAPFDSSVYRIGGPSEQDS